GLAGERAGRLLPAARARHPLEGVGIGARDGPRGPRLLAGARVTPRALVVAKAPVAGRVKTRLGAEIGSGSAAEVAAAALLDTIAACRDAFGVDGCLLALAGDLTDAVRGDEIARALDGWSVARQRGATFSERLA